MLHLRSSAVVRTAHRFAQHEQPLAGSQWLDDARCRRWRCRYDGSNCVNLGGFLKDHQDSYFNNTCVSGVAQWASPSGCGSPACLNHSRHMPDMNVVGQLHCEPSQTVMHDNHYYSPDGNITFNCRDNGPTTLAKMQSHLKYVCLHNLVWASTPAQLRTCCARVCDCTRLSQS